MDSIQGVAVGGLFALAGGLLSALIALAIQRRQATGPLRLHLYEKQLDAHAAVARQLGALRLEVTRMLATSQVPGADVTTASRALNDRGLETMGVVDAYGFFLDRTVGEAVMEFVALAHRVRDGEQLTAAELGVAYGRTLAICHEAVSIPALARETYREAGGGRPRRWPWSRRRHDVPPPGR